MKRHLNSLVKAFKSKGAKASEMLPPSIRGVWRTDLFVGSQPEDRWVATTMKINPPIWKETPGSASGSTLSAGGARGPSVDNSKNLILCPIPYHGAFMELFYSSFFIVKQLLAADAQLPTPVALPNSDDRHVAAELVARRQVLGVVEALGPMAQPDLIAGREVGTEAKDVTTSAVAPVAKQT